MRPGPEASGKVFVLLARPTVALNQIAEVTDHWQTDPLYQDGDELFCHLLDQRGNKAKVMNYAPSYWNYQQPPAPLNVWEGEVATFALELRS